MSRRSSRRSGLGLVLALAPLWVAVSIVGCTGGGTEPSGTTFEPLRLTCPAPVSAETLTGTNARVDYATPTATGGIIPVTVACTPPSGSNFPIGSTTATCTATDGALRKAACSIPVTVSRPGDLTLTRFMAFGDSITAGSLGGPCGLAPSGVWTRAFLLEDVQRIRAYENFPASYPNVLTGLLASRYPAQATVMVNEGSPGERITDDDLGTKDSTISRLDSRLGANGPQVLLLQEGINDLNLNPNRAETFIPAVVKGLRDAANVARSRGVRVFVGALLPEHPGGCRARVPAHIEPLNDQLRAMALAEGHVFVDLHAPFVGQTGQLLGMDGLHPNELGYMKMAETFLAAIRDNLEKKP